MSEAIRLSPESFEQCIKKRLEAHTAFWVLCDSDYVLEVLRRTLRPKVVEFCDKYSSCLDNNDTDELMPYYLKFDNNGRFDDNISVWAIEEGLVNDSVIDEYLECNSSEGV